MTSAQYITQFKEYYTENKMIVVILVCIVKVVKVLVDIVIIVLFLRFIIFFLNLRKLEQRKITLFNKFILLIVITLYVITIYQ